MRNDIREKLQEALNKPITGEPQVVYILSRIRKLMEIDETKKVYNKLKSYCDWSLHKQLDSNSVFSEDLIDFPNGEMSAYFASFEIFKKEFTRFLRENSLTTNIYTTRASENNFNTILFNIYSDTPLIIKSIKKRKITLKNGYFSDNQSGFKATIEDMK